MDSLLFIFIIFIFLWSQTHFILTAKNNIFFSFVLLLLAYQVNTSVSYFLIFLSFVWLLFAIIFLSHSVRKKIITIPLYNQLKKKLPAISETEKTAIEAGTVWWEADLFKGQPDFQTLLSYPKPQLSEEEKEFIDGPVNHLCQLLDDWQITHDLNDLPNNVWQYIKEQRFFGMIIPKQYGGLEFSAYAHSNVVMKISARSLTAAVTVMVPNSLGPAELLLHYGTEKQKKYYLPRLANGTEIPCFALTGPYAGSDAGAIPDKGIVCERQYKGKKTLGFIINWEKRYITLGPVATVLGLAFKAYDPDGLLGEKESLGITCALIPTKTKGVTIGNRHYPLNSAFQNGPNQGHNVFVPMEWIIGEQKQIGKGWKMLVESLSAGRGISLPALAAGAGKHALRTTGAYARVRKQFKTPIGKFEGVEEAISELAGKTYLMDAGRQLTLSALDSGEKPSVVSAILKYHNTEMMRQVVNNAMDIQGGRAICMGPSNYLARAYQTVPVGITVEGANILTRSMIIFGQGAMRCHPWLIKEIGAIHVNNVEQAQSQFDKALLGHLGYFLSNVSRAFIFGISGSHLAKSPVGGRMSVYYKRLSQMSAAFAVIADVSLMLLGGSFKRKEKLSGRFADALSYLFYTSAALKKFHMDGEQQHQIALAEWACKYSLFQVQKALDEILRNFPSKMLGLFIRGIIFPLGLSLRLPNDRQGQRVAAQMIKNSKLRDEVTEGLYINDDPSDVTGRLEYALLCVEQAQVIEKKLKSQGIKVDPMQDFEHEIAKLLESQQIDQQESEILLKTHQAIRHAIMVDDFKA